MMLQEVALKSFGGIVALGLAACICTVAQTKAGPADPGVRGGPAGAGAPLQGLTADETAFFQDGLARFAEVESVTKGANNGLGPRFSPGSQESVRIGRRARRTGYLSIFVDREGLRSFSD